MLLKYKYRMKLTIFLTSVFIVAFPINLYSEGISSDATSVYESVQPSLCAITALDPRGEQIGFGSGFIYSKDGKIITNFHVISGATFARVDCGGQNGIVKKIIGYQSGIDLVILQTEIYESTPLTVSKEENFKPGAVVFALGNPYGFQGTITAGLIGGIREFDGVEYIQISADINPGNSGGPIVNQSGEVIGIATMSLTRAQGLNFALPAKFLSNLPAVDLSLEDISTRDQVDMKINSFESTLSFRGLPLGSKCEEILKQGELVGKKSVDIFFKTSGRFLPPSSFSSPKNEVNMNGSNYIIHKLVNQEVAGVYNCKEGIFYSAKYEGIARNNESIIINSIESRYGKPKITTKNILENKTIVWNIKEGQVITYIEDFSTISVLYQDKGLDAFLEKKQQLRVSESGDL